MSDVSVVVLGSLNMDVVLRVDRLPRPGETVTAASIRHMPGGKGANQAVAARRAGAAVRMIGAVGTDPFGDALLGVLADEGIDVRSQRVAGPSGVAHVVVDRAGENCIIVAPGANGALSPDGLAEAMAGAAICLAQLEVPIDAVQAFFAAAPAGTVRMLNAAPFVPGGHVLFPMVDLICVNETELAAYVARSVSSTDLADRARALIGRPGQTVIVTLGGDGAIAVTAGDVVRVPAFPATVVDTTGAGDCFCGVLAASLAAGAPLAAALARAGKAAALAVGAAGAIPSLPDAGAIDR